MNIYNPLKRNVLPTLAFSAVFYAFFMHVKHAAGLAAVNPFASDPYDATGSVALILSGFLALLGALRAFFPYTMRASDPKRLTLILRIQAAVPLSALVYLVAAAIALVRHVPLWYPSRYGIILAVECLCMLAFTLGMLAWVLRPLKGRLEDSRLYWRRSAALMAVAVLLLAVYPEWVNHWLPGALLAIVAGVLFFNVCLQALLIWLLPHTASEPDTARRAEDRPFKTAAYWMAATVMGLLLGAGTLLSEMAESGLAPTADHLLLIAVYLGAGTFSIVVSYAFLRRPLGLG